MKVLLISPDCNLDKALGRYKKLMRPMAPINVAYLAAALRQHNHEPVVIDDLVEHLGPDGINAAIKKHKPGLVGISCLTQTAPEVFNLAASIKKKYPELPVVLGNLHASFFAENILKDKYADIIVHGEGEYTLSDLASAVEKGQDWETVHGISFRTNGHVHHTPARETIKNLDDLPFPAWELFPLKKYSLFGFAAIQEPGTLISTSRGCPYRCNFCSLLVMGHQRRKRTIKNIVDEFEYLAENFGYKQISFIDPIFPINKKEGLAFCEEMRNRGLHKKVVWSTETRVDLVDKELLREMRGSGCRRVMYGIETGDEDTLNAIVKDFDLNRAVQATRIAKKEGIEVLGFFMLGAPGETPKSIQKTIAFAKDLDIDFAKFSIFVPYPGTDIYDQFVAEGRLNSEDWERYTSYPAKGSDPIFVPDGFTGEEIAQWQKKAIGEFYLRPNMIVRHLFKIKTISPKDLVYGVMSVFS